MSEQSEAVEAARQVIAALEKLDIKFVVGGSVASISYGQVRSTMDVDLVAQMRLEHVEPFVSLLKERFYVDAQMIQGAIENRSSFNLLDLESFVKIDVFIPKDHIFYQGQIERRVQRAMLESGYETWFASAEDTVLAKLAWYRLGNEISERQWRDVLGVLKTQEDRLDVAYMREMAATLAVSDLLERAFVSLD